MKRIFTLAVALVAALGIANAQQDKLMVINRTDGSVGEFNTTEIESVTFAEAPWTSLGMCEYTEDILASMFYFMDDGDMVCTYEVEIQENTETPGLFRLVNPYGEAYPFNEPGDWDDSREYYIEINATDPDGVYIESQDTGCDWGYGRFYVWSYADYLYQYGFGTRDAIKEMGWCGTYADGVITFPLYGLVLSIPAYYGYLDYANYDEAFKIVMPSAREAGAPRSTNGKGTVDKSAIKTKVSASGSRIGL